MIEAKDTSNICWEDFYYYDESSPTYLRNTISKVGVKKHSVAGTLNKKTGYAFVKLNGSVYPVHRVIWEMFNGSLAINELIDHKNGIRKDNSIGNLRVCSEKTNRYNVARSGRNKSGVCGVRYRQDKSSWVGYVKSTDGKDLQRSFSTTKYGYITAKLLAKLWRETKISELNTLGAEYTTRHGEFL